MMMKKLFLLILSFCLLFNDVSLGQAHEKGVNSELVFEYSLLDNTWVFVGNEGNINSVLMYDLETDILSGSISFDRGVVYEYKKLPHPGIEEKLTDEFWLGAVSYMKENLTNANYIEGNIEDYDEIDLTSSKSSISADLCNELNALVGSEYTDVFKNSTTYSGYLMTIRESMLYRISKKRTFSWKTPISIASYCASFLSISSPSSTVISKVALVFGITSLASSLIPAGSSNEYRCRAMYTRVTYVSRNNYPCNSTSKYADYFGIDDGNLNSTNRAHIYSQYASNSYSHSATYYSSYSQQYSDAYMYYLQYYNHN